MTAIDLKSKNAPPPPELLVNPVSGDEEFSNAVYKYARDLTIYLNRYFTQSTQDLRKISGTTLDADALALIGEFADDGKITPAEKVTAYRLWLNLVTEATPVTGTIPIQAAVYSVNDSDFDTAFAALDTYLNTTIAVFDDMEVTTLATRTEWNAAWNEYENQRTLLTNAITTAAADAAELASFPRASDAYRTMAWRADANLDASFPLELDWKIPANITAITAVYLSFKIKPFRTDSTAAASGGSSTPTSSAGGAQTSSAGGAQTSSSGGSQTPTSSSGGAQTSSSGGAQTSSSGGGWTKDTSYAHALAYPYDETGTNSGAGDPHYHAIPEPNSSGHYHSISAQAAHTHTVDDHTHTVANHTHTVAVAAHTHTVADHTHTVADHTHTVTIAAHTHGITYGIYEEDNAPISITYQVNNGAGYGASSAAYTSDQTDLDITAGFTGTGWKGVKFLSDKRARIVPVIEFQGTIV